MGYYTNDGFYVDGNPPSYFDDHPLTINGDGSVVGLLPPGGLDLGIKPGDKNVYGQDVLQQNGPAVAGASGGGSVDDQVRRILASHQPLSAVEAQLNALGVKLQKDSAGNIRGRLYLPDGRSVDVGLNGEQWVDHGVMGPDTGGNASAGLLGSGGPGTFQPNITPFAPASFTPTPFTAPTLDDTTDPGYQFRLDQGNKAYQNSAFAKGVGLTGGTAKGAIDYAQGAASAEYGNVFTRALQANQTNNGYNLSAATANNNSGLAANQNAFTQLLQTHQTQYNDLFNLANLGYQATQSSYS